MAEVAAARLAAMEERAVEGAPRAAVEEVAAPAAAEEVAAAVEVAGGAAAGEVAAGAAAVEEEVAAEAEEVAEVEEPFRWLPFGFRSGPAAATTLDRRSWRREPARHR